MKIKKFDNKAFRRLVRHMRKNNLLKTRPAPRLEISGKLKET